MTTKRIFIFSAIVILLLIICATASYFLYSRGVFNTTGGDDSGTTSSSGDQAIDDLNGLSVVDRSRQYKLLYSLDLTNSLRLLCNWGDIAYNWSYPTVSEEDVFKATTETVSLDPATDNTDNDNPETTYKNENDAVSAFFKQYPDANSLLKYDYLVEVFSSDLNASDIIPLYSTVKGKKIHSSNLGIWKQGDGKFVAGLYEVAGSFKQYNFDLTNSEMKMPLIKEEELKKKILLNEVMFINHTLLCENENIEKVTIESVEIVYLPLDEFIVPVYKIVGDFRIEFRRIKWTALVNPIDFVRLDYSAYDDQSSDTSFTPRAYIVDARLQKDIYTIEGILPNTLKKDDGGDVKGSDYKIEFLSTEETGEYVYGERKDKLLDEIEGSIEVKDDGRFTFTFTGNNFWRVEKLIYDDAGEATHSAVNEVDRYSYDNWFKIKVCTFFEGGDYCGDESNIVYLTPLKTN